MPLKPTEKIWHNGKMIPWSHATIHVMSHVTNYGSSVFEGIRYYSTPGGPAVFRLKDHMRRMLDSAKIYRMDLGFSLDELVGAACDVVAANGLPAGYLRPLAVRGYGEIGVSPLNAPIELYIATWEWGKYLGHDALENGVDVCVSSWHRMAQNTLPAAAKAGANYMNSQLIKMEATANGYAEGIALDSTGMVSEGSGENIFVVRDGALYTPPLSASILPGITRDSVMRIARDMGIVAHERAIPREWLYLADELFFCGTAVEISPIRSVDRIEIGTGKRGAITKKLQDRFFPIVQGRAADEFGWLTPVPAREVAREPILA